MEKELFRQLVVGEKRYASGVFFACGLVDHLFEQPQTNR